MKNELSAEEIWSTIEAKHSSEKNMIGRSYSTTLSNGITYIYKALPNGRLLCIDDWFEGYVEILGSQEVGLIYAVKFEKTVVSFYEFIGDSFNSKPTVSLKYTKKIIDELKVFAGACGPIRIVQDYTYEKKRYWVIESYDEKSDGLIIVYNITENKIHEKYRNKFKYPISDAAVVYRFPFAPYKYGIISASLPYYYHKKQSFFIYDFSKNQKQIISNFTQSYLHIFEYGDNRWALFAKKIQIPIAFIKYNEYNNKITIFTDCVELLNSQLKKQRNNNEDLTTDNDFSNNYNSIEDIVKSLQAINTVVPDDKYMSEGINSSYTLSHITNKKDEEVILVKELVNFLKSCMDTNDFVPVDYYIHRLYYLRDACNEFDSKRLLCFIKTILSRMRTNKYLLESNKTRVKIDFLVHNITSGDLRSHMVEEHCSHWVNGSFVKDYIPVDFYHDCYFDLSIRINIDFEPQKEFYYYNNEQIDEYEFSSDNLDFEDFVEPLIKNVPQVQKDSSGERFYKFVLPKSEDNH